mgnify:CR=1 FL=1
MTKIRKATYSKILDDGTKLYDYVEAVRLQKVFSRPQITVDELVLFLLSLSERPVIGRISLFKELFLLYEEIKEKIQIQNPKFVSYKYGPYSFYIQETLDWLEYSGFIERRGKRNTRLEKFRLSDLGRKIAHNVMQRMKELLGQNEIERLKKLRMGWDQLGTDGLLKYVYQFYPEYRERSEIANKFKNIKWGKGKG